jgi:hypothetical protein
MCTGLREYLLAVWMDLALSRREESMQLQPQPISAITAWLLAFKGCLLRCGLPRLNLLEASLAVKEPRSSEANEWALEPPAP